MAEKSREYLAQIASGENRQELDIKVPGTYACFW
jgi:hypothetical protein